MKRVLFLSLLFGLLGLASCKKVDADGNQVMNNVVTSSFTEIDNETGINVSYSYDASTSITVTTTQEVFDILTFEITGTTLKLGVKSGYTIKNVNEVQMHITAPVITKLCISGSGNINGNFDYSQQISTATLIISGSGTIYADSLSAPEQEFAIPGSGTISVGYVNATDVRSIISGSGTILAEGEADVSDISISGSGWISEFELDATDADVLISGSGSCEVKANSLLDVTISGSGNVYYKGTPQINVNGSGSGSLINAN